MSKRRVSYFYDGDVGNFSYGLGHPMKPHRMRMAHALVSAYKMLEKMDVVRPTRATPQQMTRFHTDEYVDFLNRVTPETGQEMTHGGTRFLVGEDNPAFDGLFEFCSISAGGSINAAERLNSGKSDIAINWAGGLHHAKKREASGFCYVNDIVLAILELLRYHSRVLYIDIDCHHGDGVEEAFYTTDRVLTCSFHKQKDYFPGTGRMEDGGKGRGNGYSVNVPLLNGVTDDEYRTVFEPVIQHIMDWYQPGAVVLQCGADSLSGDKLGVFNLSMHGHANCVRFLRKFNVPLILLGGGGYTIKNVSCAWTYETACALGMEEEIDLNLPYNPYLEYYGPRYRLEVEPNNMTDDNVPYLDQTRISVLERLRDLPFAPSVGMQSVPSTSVSQETGIRVREAEDEEDSDMSDLDVRIAQRVRDTFNRTNGSSSTTSTSEDAPLRRSLLSFLSDADRHRYEVGRMHQGHQPHSRSDDEDDQDATDEEDFIADPRLYGSNSRKGPSSRLPMTPLPQSIDGLVFGTKSWLSTRDNRRRPRKQEADDEAENDYNDGDSEDFDAEHRLLAASYRPKRSFFRRDVQPPQSDVWDSGADRALANGVGFMFSGGHGGGANGALGGDADLAMDGDADDAASFASGSRPHPPPTTFPFPVDPRGRGSPMSVS